MKPRTRAIVAVACTLASGFGIQLGTRLAIEYFLDAACLSESTRGSCELMHGRAAALALTYLGAWACYVSMAVAWVKGSCLHPIVPLAGLAAIAVWFWLISFPSQLGPVPLVFFASWAFFFTAPSILLALCRFVWNATAQPATALER